MALGALKVRRPAASASGVSSAGRLWAASLCARVSALARSQWRCMLMVLHAKSDEASRGLRVRSSNTSSDAGNTSTSVLAGGTSVGRAVRVLCARARLALLLQSPAKAFFMVGMPVPCPLRPLERTTTELLHEAQPENPNTPGTQSIEPFFEQAAVAPTQDRSSANEKQAHVAQNEEKGGPEQKGRTRLALVCVVHIAATICTKTFDMVHEAVSGLIAEGISMRAPNRFEELRNIITEVSLACLHICRRGSPPAEGSHAFEHRRRFLDLVFPVHQTLDEEGCPRPGFVAMHARRLLHERPFHPDISERIIMFYADDTMTDEDVKMLFKNNVADALLPTPPPPFARSRWNGFEHAFRSASLLCGTHEIGEEALQRWCPSKKKKTVAAAITDGYCSDEDGVKQPTKLTLCDSTPCPAIAPAVEDEEHGNPEPSHEALVIFHVRKRVACAEWAATKPRQVMVLSTIIGQHLAHLIHAFMYRASSRWDATNAARVAANKPPLHRTLEAHRICPELKCGMQLLRLLVDPKEWGASRQADCTSACTGAGSQPPPPVSDLDNGDPIAAEDPPPWIQEAPSDEEFLGDPEIDFGIDGVERGGRPSPRHVEGPAATVDQHGNRKWIVPGGFIVMYINKEKREFGAHRQNPDHVDRTNPRRLNRTAAADRRSPDKHPRGRPLRLLLVWLEAGGCKCSRTKHSQMVQPRYMSDEDKALLSHERRSAARAAFEGDARYADMFRCERPRRHNEPPEPLELV